MPGKRVASDVRCERAQTAITTMPITPRQNTSSEAVKLGTEARGFDIETEIGIKAKARGLREAEIPISYLPRVGEKKLSPWKDGLRILGRVLALPDQEDDQYDESFTEPGLAYKAGVKFAFGTFNNEFVRNLPYQAATAVGFGLPYDEALKAVTINAAQIWGHDKEIGSVEKGKWADLMVTTGDPLEILAIHEALDRLAAKSPRKAELVKLRYFLGCTMFRKTKCKGTREVTPELTEQLQAAAASAENSDGEEY